MTGPNNKSGGTKVRTHVMEIVMEAARRFIYRTGPCKCFLNEDSQVGTGQLQLRSDLALINIDTYKLAATNQPFPQNL